MSPRKSRGADGWGPHELGSLPLAYLRNLSTLIANWEAAGRWPEELCQILVFLMPKPGAMTEAQLRPIGLLPYVYRAWLASRKADATGWSKKLHGGSARRSGRLGREFAPR